MKEGALTKVNAVDVSCNCPINIKEGVSTMRTFTTILFTCLLSFSFTGAAYAQWVQTNGPYGGGVIAFMATDSDIFVSNRWSVFHSTNNGVNWSQVAADLPEFLNITSLAKVGANLFAGCDDMRGYGIFLSTDNGTTWTQTNNGLANLYVEVLACKDTNLFAGTDGGVFLSANNGKNWTAINNGLTNLYVHTLAITGTSIFAGTNGGGIFCSTDNGASWTPADSGLPTSNGSIFVLLLLRYRYLLHDARELFGPW